MAAASAPRSKRPRFEPRSTLADRALRAALPADLSRVVIEITEHELVGDDSVVAAAISDLRSRGARIAIDDAGAGYAGLKQVMQVRPDIVKLDRELTRGIHQDRARMALIESFVRFTRRVGAVVCAEGIESLDEVTALAELDVAWGQGFALAKPAAPWAEVSPIAAEVCRATLAQALRATPALGEAVAAGDRRLEHLSARLAAVRSRRDLESVLALIAAELDADQVCVSQLDRSHEVLETLAENGTPTGDTVYWVHDYPLTSHVIATRESAQVRVGDPSTDPSEAKLLLALGHRSLLIVPVVSRGETLGIIESYRRSESPWTRTDINRARIISSQFASVIESLRHEPRPAS
jgi:GAF domain-containing protein